MPRAYTKQELIEACITLFGPQIPRSTDFLKYLRHSGIKAAYRKRAMETHPDCHFAVQNDREHDHDRFIRVNKAYQILTNATFANRLQLPAKAEPPESKNYDEDRSCQTCTKQPHKSFYPGNLPPRELRFGQFLFYSGIITWEDLVQAIVWQQRNRPRIGQIAMGWKLLGREGVTTILNAKRPPERFGETALRKGLLTPYNILALLGKQRLMNQSIGQYFVEAGLLTRRQIDGLVGQQQIHNRHFPKRPPASAFSQKEIHG